MMELLYSSTLRKTNMEPDKVLFVDYCLVRRPLVMLRVSCPEHTASTISTLIFETRAWGSREEGPNWECL